MSIYTDTQPATLANEEALLGGLLAYPAALDRDGMPQLAPSDFMDPRHGTIYAAITAAWSRTGLTEPQTVVAELAAAGELARIGGAPRIADLVSSAAVIGAIPWHAERVIEAAKLRTILAAVTRAQQAVIGAAPVDANDFDQLITTAWTDLQDAFTRTHNPTERDSLTVGEIANDRVAQLLAGIEEPHIPTGLVDLDRAAGKLLVPGRITVIGARPAVGKSVFAMQIAVNAAAAEHSTLYISLEMTKEEVVDRMLSNLGRIPHDHIKSPKLLTQPQRDRLERVRQQLQSFPLEILDKTTTTIADVTALIRNRARGERRLELAIVDYIQLFPTRKAENRQVEVAEISRAIKRLAMEQRIAIISVAQVNRASEATGDKRPALSMLKESGALEADADQVILLHRDDIANPDSDHAGMMDLIVAKNRHGATATVPVATQFEYCRVDNLIHEA